MMDMDNYILGDAALHHRLSLTAAILAEVVRCAPRSLSISRLENATGHPTKSLQKTCRSLCRSGLLLPGRDGSWLLAGSPDDITLEHVFRSVLKDVSSCGKRVAARDTSARAPNATNDIELLLMQATVGINQSVFKHLRRFSLDRLKLSAAGMPPVHRKQCDFCCDEAPPEQL